MVDAFKEPNRRVIAKCRACKFEIHGPLLRVAIDTGHPCRNCGALGTFVIYHASSARRTQTGARSFSPPVPDTDVSIGPRHHKTQGGSHSVMPSGIKSGSNLSVSPMERS